MFLSMEIINLMWTKYGTAIAARAGVETSTRGYAASIAHAVGGQAETIFNELIANLVSNSRMVPAGIVGVDRARSEDIRS
jgi:hypothetical protein